MARAEPIGLAVFLRAQSVYRQKMLLVHPDRGGEPDAAVQLNANWAAIEKCFARQQAVEQAA